MVKVEVMRGRFGDPIPLFGPLPGVRDGNVVAYEFALPDQFVPWPATTRLQRTFVLLDLGISFGVPCWHRFNGPEGVALAGLDPDGDRPSTWYVDLVHVIDEGDTLTFRDLYLDVMVPVDGRHYRLLDLDEFADALADGALPVEVAVDGMRRWQTFLDRHVHRGRAPAADWRDFPPKAIEALAALAEPLGPVVTWQG